MLYLYTLCMHGTGFYRLVRIFLSLLSETCVGRYRRYSEATLTGLSLQSLS